MHLDDLLPTEQFTPIADSHAIELEEHAKTLADVARYEPGMSLMTPTGSMLPSGHALSNPWLQAFRHASQETLKLHMRPHAIVPVTATCLAETKENRLFLLTGVTTSGTIVTCLATHPTSSPSLLELRPVTSAVAYPALPPVPAAWLDAPLSASILARAIPAPERLVEKLSERVKALSSGFPHHSR